MLWLTDGSMCINVRLLSILLEGFFLFFLVLNFTVVLLCKLVLLLQVLKCSSKLSKVQALEAVDYGDADPGGTIALYGRWQMEPLCLPCAVNGIVPKVKSNL